MEQIFIFLPAVLAVLGLLFMLVKSNWINKQNTGNERMLSLSRSMQEGAMAFLRSDYRILLIFVVVAAIALFAISQLVETTSWIIVIAFVFGAVFSALAGNIGMRVATQSNVRTTQAARSSLPQALKISFSGGTVMGLGVAGLAVLGLSIFFLIFLNMFISDGGDFYYEMTVVLEALAGFSLGAESIALLARVGGGIFTKAADVGADLVGKVEAGIPEDDPRNPATIADNVGDNVGDVAGMGADLYESYVGSILATFAIGASAGYGWNDMFLPLAIAVVGVICSLIGSFMIKTGEKASQRELLKSMRTGTYFAAALCAVLCIPLTWYVMKDVEGASWIGILISIFCGLAAGCAIGYVTEYYTSDTYKPTQALSDATETGAATTIIGGISLGMISTAAPILIVGVAVIVSFIASGGSLVT